MKLTDLTNVKLYSFADIIKSDWKNVNYAARPYLHAMHFLNYIDEKYINDSGYEIVARFLCNAAAWRGETARLVKAELKRRLANH